MGLGKGIGPVTANLLLREMRPVGPKADPPVSPLAVLAARDLGLAKGKGNPQDALRNAWSAEKERGYDFSDFEAALVRLGKDYRRKARVTDCTPDASYATREDSFRRAGHQKSNEREEHARWGGRRERSW